MTVLAPCVSKVAHRMFYLNLDPEGGVPYKKNDELVVTLQKGTKIKINDESHLL